MISFVPLALSIQNKQLPESFPNFVLSIGEIAFFTRPAALLQICLWWNDEEFAFGGDLCYLSLIYDAWKSRKGLDVEVDLDDE